MSTALIEIFVAIGIVLGVAIWLWLLKSKEDHKANALKSEDHKANALKSRFDAWKKEKAGSFVINKVGGVIGVCRKEDFDRTLREYENRVKDGTNEPWEKVILLVHPTFTFFPGDNPENMMQVGGSQDLQQIIEDFVKMNFDASDGEMFKHEFPNCYELEWKSLKSPLVRQDNRLFVPFVSETSLSFKKQAEMYPRVTFVDARKHFIRLDDSLLSIYMRNC